MKFRECMQELKRLLKNNKWMIVFLIIVLFIRIKNSEVPVIKLISNIPIITTILLKPRENTVYAEDLMVVIIENKKPVQINFKK